MKTKWVQAYQDKKKRKMLFPNSPAGAGRVFLDFLQTTDRVFEGKLLDIGCGNGRNAFALAELGFEVYGIDFIEEAMRNAERLSAQVDKAKNDPPASPDVSASGGRGKIDNVHFMVGDLGEPWPYEDEFFDFAIDVSTFSSLSVNARDNYLKELPRVLKQGGLYFLYTYTAEDGYYASASSRQRGGQAPQMGQPGVGKKVVSDDDGIERILYTEDELKKIFSENFKLLHQEQIMRYGKMFDIYYKRAFVTLVFEVM